MLGRELPAANEKPFEEYEEYEVEEGDTWDLIAAKVYGDPSLGNEIAAANPRVGKLEPGMIIRIPVLEEVPEEVPDEGAEEDALMNALMQQLNPPPPPYEME